MNRSDQSGVSFKIGREKNVVVAFSLVNNELYADHVGTLFTVLEKVSQFLAQKGSVIHTFLSFGLGSGQTLSVQIDFVAFDGLVSRLIDNVAFSWFVVA